MLFHSVSDTTTFLLPYKSNLVLKLTKRSMLFYITYMAMQFTTFSFQNSQDLLVWVSDVNGTFPLRGTLFVLLSAWVIAWSCNVRSKSNCSEEVSAANHYFQKRYLFPQVLVCRRRCAGCYRNCDKWRSQEQLVLLNFSGQSCCRRPLKTTQTSRALRYYAMYWRESSAVWFESFTLPASKFTNQ